MGSNHRDDRPSTVARSLPQMPARRGRTRCQSGPGSSGGSTSASRSGPDPAAGARPPSRRHPGRGEAGDGPLDLQRLHRAAGADAAGTEGSSGRGPPGAFGHCSTCQPRLRAMAASLVSGLTATGWPAASSMGRSLAESA